MSSAYTVLWAKEFRDEVCRAGDEGKPLTVLFGGAHQSCPSLARAGVTSGDIVFPVFVQNGLLHIIAAAVAKEFIGIEAYLREHLRLETAGVPEHQIRETIETKLGSLGHRMRYVCGAEVLLVERSSPIRFDMLVPPEKLEEVLFCPRKGPQAGLNHIESGKLKSAISLQGNVRRMCPQTARLFSELTGLDRTYETNRICTEGAVG